MLRFAHIILTPFRRRCNPLDSRYNWIHRGWDIKRRARFFENRWAYFAGFGACAA